MFLSSALQLLVTANVVPISRILFTLIMEAILSSKTPALTRATRLHVLEDDLVHCYTIANGDCFSGDKVAGLEAARSLQSSAEDKNDEFTTIMPTWRGVS
jgi:hypothetical protein